MSVAADNHEPAKKWIIFGLVLVAIGNFVGIRTSQGIKAGKTMPVEDQSDSGSRSGPEACIDRVHNY